MRYLRRVGRRKTAAVGGPLVYQRNSRITATGAVPAAAIVPQGERLRVDMHAEFFGVNPRRHEQEIEPAALRAGEIGAQRIADRQNALA